MLTTNRDYKFGSSSQISRIRTGVDMAWPPAAKGADRDFGDRCDPDVGRGLVGVRVGVDELRKTAGSVDRRCRSRQPELAPSVSKRCRNAWARARGRSLHRPRNPFVSGRLNAFLRAAYRARHGAEAYAGLHG